MESVGVELIENLLRSTNCATKWVTTVVVNADDQGFLSVQVTGQVKIAARILIPIRFLGSPGVSVHCAGYIIRKTVKCDETISKCQSPVVTVVGSYC